MYDLKCKRQSCTHNKNCNCTSKRVEVSKDSECKTFEPGQTMKHQEEKIGQPPIRKDIKVGCKADCIFNNNNVCSANGITVQTCTSNTGEACPTCCTFQPE